MTKNEVLQTIRMCVQTHINLYGYLPTLSEMAKQVDASLHLIQKVLCEYADNRTGMPIPFAA